MFIRCGRVRKQLDSSYDEEFRMLASNTKICRNLRNDKEDPVGIDRVKAAVARSRLTRPEDKNVLMPYPLSLHPHSPVLLQTPYPFLHSSPAVCRTVPHTSSLFNCTSCF
nr:unnamed protein product [Spirometra erinaceieuropaei]